MNDISKLNHFFFKNNRIRANEQKKADIKTDEVKEGALPTYLLDRENVNRTKVKLDFF